MNLHFQHDKQILTLSIQWWRDTVPVSASVKISEKETLQGQGKIGSTWLSKFATNVQWATSADETLPLYGQKKKFSAYKVKSPTPTKLRRMPEMS